MTAPPAVMTKRSACRRRHRRWGGVVVVLTRVLEGHVVLELGSGLETQLAVRALVHVDHRSPVSRCYLPSELHAECTYDKEEPLPWESATAG